MTTIPTNKRNVVIGLAVTALMIGIGIGSLLRTNPVKAEAAVPSTAPVMTTVATDGTTTHPPINRMGLHRGRHGGINGRHGELLTGDIAVKVTDAALKAFPDSTIRRVEKGLDGVAYEVHLAKADGSRVRAHFDADLNLVSQEACPGGHGHQPPISPIN